jgi:hypothetical protein
MVLESAVVGFCTILQHTPRAVTVAPPSLVILPPQFAVVGVIEFTFQVFKTGGCPWSFSFLQLLVRINTNPNTIKWQIQILFFVFMIHCFEFNDISTLLKDFHISS